MNNKEKLKLEIEQLKDKKEDLKFGHRVILDKYFDLLIFLGTITVATSLKVSLTWVFLSFINFLLLSVCAYIYFFKPSLEIRYKKIVDLQEEIEEKYNKLIV